MKMKRRLTYTRGFCDGRQHKHSWGEHGKMQSNNHGSLSGSKVKLNDGGGMD